ncbi:MAG: hypothetical protein CL663_01175 [Bacteroidetes bacterium]|nr:hypothetical protein [Bacteroidota bacterium]
MKRKKLNIIALSIALLSITLVYFGVIPTREKTVPDSRKVVFRACYEGTQNQATFKLFENNEFELHWSGAFFYRELFTGTYKEKSDTLFLNYETAKAIRFGEKILMDSVNEQLITIRHDGDSLVNVVAFYYGFCKGLN